MRISGIKDKNISVIIKKLAPVAAVIVLILLLLINAAACKRETAENSTSELISENEQKTSDLTYGKSLKSGDYIQFGNYQVEDEGYNPILWVVIDNNSHYAGYVNPEVEHITLMSTYIIDLRGFDAVEPENANELRRGYGNGRYRTSNMRQWLNSSGDENSWWTSQNLDEGEPGTNNADAPPSDEGFPDFDGTGYEDKTGFLKSFTEVEFEAIINTMLTVGKNEVVDGGGSESVIDKIFLLSLTEIGLGDRSEYEEGEKFDFFDSGRSRQAEITTRCIDKTKYLDKSSKDSEENNWPWWVRTPSPGFPASTFIVSSIGAALNSTANMSEGPVGVRPALNLKTDLYFTGSGTKDDPYIIAEGVDMDAVAETGVLKDEEAIEDSDQENGESHESEEAEIVTIESSELSDGDKLLQSVSLNAVDDYPEWTIDGGSMVVWNGLEKNKEIFAIRQSPDNESIGIQSPAEEISGGDIAALDFIDKNTVGYAVVSQNNGKCTVGLLQFEFANTGAEFSSSYNAIYEKDKITSVRDISFINRNEFLIFYILENQRGKETAVVSYINVGSGKEGTLLEFDVKPPTSENTIDNIQKVSVSSKGTYTYIVYKSASKEQGSLAVFDLSNREQIDEINYVSSAVWIGDKNILYSSSDEDGKAFIYNLENNKSYEVTKVDSYVVNLSFCPESGGVIIYNIDPLSYQAKAHALSCKNWEEQGMEKNCIFNAIADEETVIFSKYAQDESNDSNDFIIKEGGYLNLKFKWARHLTEEFLTSYQNTVLATVWSRY
ncbi:MAG: hypothetical protein A2Z35_01350 [Actinobacteria bacterium RBG_19FT_COMBO_36_27]|nr:MAG: hypothetical protein A2Z35_01350 [Actinobacteria bacterium RBG_19FT_COMBO_36_27]